MRRERERERRKRESRRREDVGLKEVMANESAHAPLLV